MIQQVKKVQVKSPGSIIDEWAAALQNLNEAKQWAEETQYKYESGKKEFEESMVELKRCEEIHRRAKDEAAKLM